MKEPGKEEIIYENFFSQNEVCIESTQWLHCYGTVCAYSVCTSEVLQMSPECEITVHYVVKLCVLVLAGIELIFFIVVSMGLFWICAENSVDNTEMFPLLLSSADTGSRPFLLLTPSHQQAGWGYTRS